MLSPIVFFSSQSNCERKFPCKNLFNSNILWKPGWPEGGSVGAELADANKCKAHLLASFHFKMKGARRKVFFFLSRILPHCTAIVALQPIESFFATASACILHSYLDFPTCTACTNFLYPRFSALFVAFPFTFPRKQIDTCHNETMKYIFYRSRNVLVLLSF